VRDCRGCTGAVFTAVVVGLAQAALDGKIDLERFVTKTISLAEVPDALEDFDNAKGVRTVVRL